MVVPCCPGACTAVETDSIYSAPQIAFLQGDPFLSTRFRLLEIAACLTPTLLLLYSLPTHSCLLRMSVLSKEMATTANRWQFPQVPKGSPQSWYA